MGYACYERNGRDQGYGVPAKCDHPECNKDIDRGIGYACGGDPMENCGLFFFAEHIFRTTKKAVSGLVQFVSVADTKNTRLMPNPTRKNGFSTN
jgi:hypothetical protein